MRRRAPAHPGGPRPRAASTPPCAAAGCGRCASTPASARPKRPTRAFGSCSTPARPASAPPSTFPPRWATTPTIRWRRARGGGRAPVRQAMSPGEGEEEGVGGARLGGRIQNDVLKEFIARGTYIFPPEPSLRLGTDVFRFVVANDLAFNPISI